MSEKIKITIVINNEKTNSEKEENSKDLVVVTHDLSMTLMSTLVQKNLMSGDLCGGRGVCGRCRIRLLEGDIPPSDLERSVMRPKELEQGYRLACAARPKDDCVIQISTLDSPQIAILTDVIAVTEKNDHISQQKNGAKNQRSSVTESNGADSKTAVDNTARTDGKAAADNTAQTDGAAAADNAARTDGIAAADNADCVVAVDLGTTTIAMQLTDAESGKIEDTYCEMNPQRSYGADVLSRIQASCDGSRETLRKMAVGVLERGVAHFRKHTNKKIVCMCIAGNTAMEHLFMGHDVSGLGRSPFTPVETGLQEYRHPEWDFPVWLVPAISAFAGGDIVAGLYACGMLGTGFSGKTCAADQPGKEAGTEGCPEREADAADQPGKEAGTEDCPGRKTRAADILVDLGTNGEMAVTDGVRMIAAAAAAGPAFEGGAGAGIVGSDMIACTAELLDRGILDETGLMKEPYFTDGVSAGDPPVRLNNRDIRGLQMAKAAVRAGIEILWDLLGASELGQVYLAGGFGYYLNVEAAFRIGLFPEFMRGHVRAVGNTSLAGAGQIGRALYHGTLDGRLLEEAVSHVEKVNLAEREEFGKMYIGRMNFPDAGR